MARVTNKKTTKVCSKCNENKKNTEFYLASTNLINADGRLSICKSCLLDMVDYEEEYSIKTVLRVIDKPFIDDVYKKSLVSNAENPFREYMRRLAMKHHKDMTWADSDTTAQPQVTVGEDTGSSPEDEMGDYSSEELHRLKTTWGNRKPEEYGFLESFYQSYANTYPTDNPVQVNLYRNITVTQLLANKHMMTGETKNYKEMMELSSKLHNDANIKPIQTTGANDDKGLSTYGLRIRDIETREPAEYFEDKELYADYDGIQKYWENWFVRPFKNIFNIGRDFEIKE